MTKYQKKQLDGLWQEKVTGDMCSVPSCNRVGSEGHHIMKRRYLNTRWNIENGRALCRKCHLWAETNPQAYEDLILAELGEIEYGRLREQALMVRKQYFNEVKEMLNSA